MSLTLVLYIALPLLFGLSFVLLPHVWRPGLFFSVTVPREFRASDEASRILRTFRVRVAGMTLAALAVLLGTQSAGLLTAGAVLVMALLQNVALTAVFVRARRATLLHAIEADVVREASLQPWPTILPGGLPAAAGPLILLGVTALAAIVNWQYLPARIPTHWTFSGPDVWIERVPRSIAGFLLLRGSAVALLMVATLGMVRFIGRTATTGESARAEARFRRLRVLFFVFLAYLLAFQALGALFLTRYSWSSGLLTAVQYLIPAAAIGCVAALYLMGQGGSRLTKSEHSSLGDRRADHLWKLGFFYFNPDDPALFVETRAGVGYSLNFGNRWSWLALLLIPLMIGSITLL